jgi:hypothetical protein
MSALRSSAVHSPVRVQAAMDLAVAWPVSRDAVLASTAKVAAPIGEDLRLVWKVSGEEAACVLTDGRAECRVVSAIAVTRITSDGIEHVDAGEALSLTVRNGIVLYARTNAFSLLGIPGGRYGAPVASPI